MNHKRLLALFLCLVIVFSSKIILLNNDNVVMVKDVSTSTDEYTIDNIKEENDNLKIDIYYPVTKYENINLEIMKKVEEYILKVKESPYISNEKSLYISFECKKEGEITNFKFSIVYNLGLVHDKEECFEINYIDGKMVELSENKSEKDTN